MSKRIILRSIIIIAFLIIGVEIYFYYFNFNSLLKDRIFTFEKPDYINYWLLTFVSFAILTRVFGLIRFLSDNKQGFREYSFGQLMLIALLCKEFFRYTFYVYIKQRLETGNWKTLTNFLLLFSIEIGLLVYFYFASLKMSEHED
jgi:hypothetical protein